jgi:hypothetical protein
MAMASYWPHPPRPLTQASWTAAAAQVALVSVGAAGHTLMARQRVGRRVACRVVGRRHQPPCSETGAQEAAAEGQVVLQREPDNPADPCALLVCVWGGRG